MRGTAAARLKASVALLGAAVLGAALLAAPPGETLAAWVTQENAAGSMTALTLPTVGTLGCTNQTPSLLPTEVTVTWPAATGMPAGAEYEVVLTKGTQTASLYTSTTGVVITNSSLDLLGFLLGSSGTATVTVNTVLRSAGVVTWRSLTASSRTIKYTAPIIGLLLGGWTCS